MPDKRFFAPLKPISATAIAELVGGAIVAGEGTAVATTVGTPQEAQSVHGAGVLCFIAHKKYIPAVKSGAGVICLTKPDLAPIISNRAAVVITVADPKHALGRVLQVMLEPTPSTAQNGIHPSAIIDTSASIGNGVAIGAGAVIEANAQIGDNAVIAAGVVIGRGCQLGEQTSVGANTVISHSLIGAGTVIGPLNKIGGAGFGIMQGQGEGRPPGEGQKPFPHLGRVIIGANCYIAGQCSIDRGFLGDTIIGDCVMMDSMVHIAHNVAIGAGCILCAFVGISGSCRIGVDNTFAAAAAVVDNITIGAGNVFMARAGVTKDIGDNGVWGGAPAVPHHQFRRQVALLARLSKANGRGQ